MRENFECIVHGPVWTRGEHMHIAPIGIDRDLNDEHPDVPV